MQKFVPTNYRSLEFVDPVPLPLLFSKSQKKYNSAHVFVTLQ